MKDLKMLIWLGQLGLSVVGPLGCSVLLALWLQDRFDWGDWVIWVSVIVGVICAADGLRSSLKLMSRLSKEDKDDPAPPVSFNDHD